MFEEIERLLEQYRLDISGSEIVAFFLAIFFTLVLRKLALYVFEKKLVHIANTTKTDIDNLLLDALKNPIGYLIIICGVFIAIGTLSLPENVGTIRIGKFIDSIFLLALAFVMLLLLLNIIDVIGYYIQRMTTRTETKLDEQLAPMLIKSLKIVVVTLTVLSVMESLGWNVTSLIAGLGIGGLAFALAAKETVSNIFGSVTILSDRSFQIGDWIQVGDVEGTVEDVGLRTTQIRRFDQALVTLPNSNFIQSGVINFTRMKKRRIRFYLGVTYGTSREQMLEVVEGIKKIIEDDPLFDHTFYMVHFTDFGASSLDIFVYCFTKTTVWNEFLAVRESLNLKIMHLLEELGVEVAFPSQTIYLEKVE
jgi:MscS family membrane protein